MKKYSYTILLAASFLVVLIAWSSGALVLENHASGTPTGQTDTTWEEPTALARLPLDRLSQAARREPEPVTEKEPPKMPKPEEEKPREPVFYKAGVSYFQDALFIGDSRTVGLSEYGDLGEAEVFADSGMNLYVIYKKQLAVTSGEKRKLEEVLTERQFGKIYLMLGINELGYDAEQTVKRYEEEVLKLSELQPEAKIVLEANLHVTKERSERDAIFNNENIDRINGNIRQIAEKHGFSYIDVNEIFDDETGALNPECTHDEVHVLGKYYQQWADWIRENGI